MSNKLKDAQTLVVVSQMEAILGRAAIVGEEPDLVGPNGQGRIYGETLILRGMDLSTDPATRKRELDEYAKGWENLTGIPADTIKSRILAHALPEKRSLVDDRKNRLVSNW